MQTQTVIEKAVPVYLKFNGRKELIRVEKALCPDGKRRGVTISGQPISAFSASGRVTVGGKGVGGYVRQKDGDWVFIVNPSGKNAGLLAPESEA